MMDAPFQIHEPTWSKANLSAVSSFMARPDVYWPGTDALAPQPEHVDYTQHLTHSDVCTFVATFRGDIIGYVQFNRRTSIGAEVHCFFLPHFRGKIAKCMAIYAIASVFKKGLLKLWAPIPRDNRSAVFAARHIGFVHEGTITQAIVRESGVEDLLVFGITKVQFLAKGAKRANGSTG